MSRHFAQLSFFFLRRSFFVAAIVAEVVDLAAAVTDRGYSHAMRWSGQIFWLLAYDVDCVDAHLFPAFTIHFRNTGVSPVAQPGRVCSFP